MNLKYLPNALTLLRLALIVPFLFYLFQAEYLLTFIIFFTAGLTDGLDGWLARHFNWQTPFGSIVDPIADKLLIATSFISLGLLNQLPWWLVIIVFARDFTISVGVLTWYWVVKKPIPFRPTLLSKWNTTIQLMLVTLCLFELAFFKLPFYFTPIAMYLTAITTFASYVDYIRRAITNQPVT